MRDFLVVPAADTIWLRYQMQIVKNLINKSKPLSVVFRTVANSFLLSQELQSDPREESSAFVLQKTYNFS